MKKAKKYINKTKQNKKNNKLTVECSWCYDYYYYYRNNNVMLYDTNNNIINIHYTL